MPSACVLGTGFAGGPDLHSDFFSESSRSHTSGIKKCSTGLLPGPGEF